MHTIIIFLVLINLFESKKNMKLANNYVNNILKFNQVIYKKMLSDNNLPIVICTGSAGTGKTMIACFDAIESLSQTKVEKIIITRPTITVNENLGFLPGNIEDKLYPFMVPIYDYFSQSFTKDEIIKMTQKGIIEVAPLAFMRGRTFKNSYIIADEMQNSTPEQFKMLLTRIGQDSKLVITGDIKQNDLNEMSGLENFINLIKTKYDSNQKIKSKGFGLINLENNCIQRHTIINNILSIYGE